MVSGSLRTCVIAGGGPAGMVAGLLLARGGVDVVVVEKHSDFLRDFRGDTIHPSTLALLDELGLMSRFNEIDYQRVEAAQFSAFDGGEVIPVDFSRLSHPYPYLAVAPQWEFLNLLAEAGRQEPCFELRLNTEVTGLLWADDHGPQDSPGGRVAGVTVNGPEGEEEIQSMLTVVADGRDSPLPGEAGLPAVSISVPLDVWWFKVDGRGASLAGAPMVFPRLTTEHPVLPIPRGDYVQTAMLIPKGTDSALRARGVEAFRHEVTTALPELAAAVGRLDLGDVKLLEVTMGRLKRWWGTGLLCIGDAAHPMSPVGGVGVNLAVQDGVAAARLLARPLRDGTVSNRSVAAVQQRRMLPTRFTQTFQRGVHRGLQRVFTSENPVRVPLSMTLALRQFPRLSGVLPRIIGVGVRPEHAPGWARRTPQE